MRVVAKPLWCAIDVRARDKNDFLFQYLNNLSDPGFADKQRSNTWYWDGHIPKESHSYFGEALIPIFVFDNNPNEFHHHSTLLLQVLLSLLTTQTLEHQHRKFEILHRRVWVWISIRIQIATCMHPLWSHLHKVTQHDLQLSANPVITQKRLKFTGQQTVQPFASDNLFPSWTFWLL